VANAERASAPRDDDAALAPVIVKVAVPCPPARAFEYFTRDIAHWWPLSSHSCAGDDAVDVRFDGQPGGAVTERARDGTLHRWGTVTAWEPGRRVGFTWHPGHDPATATAVEVTFAATPAGCTVTLVHHGWAARGAEAREARRSYERGWSYVLGERYAAHCRA
jgi:uncharacterized protein YndB with AHSA1/START domain